MPKEGIVNDYDLWANKEESAQNRMCIICKACPIIFRWGDYSGEAMCSQCGFPYQLKWGSPEQREEGKYPYLNIQDEYIHLYREYWNETHKFVCSAMMLGDQPGLREFNEWIAKHYPELLEPEDK